MRADEELGLSMEVVDIFLNEIVEFTCVSFQLQGDGDYLLGMDDLPNAIDSCIIPIF